MKKKILGIVVLFALSSTTVQASDWSFWDWLFGSTPTTQSESCPFGGCTGEREI